MSLYHDTTEHDTGRSTRKMKKWILGFPKFAMKTCWIFHHQLILDNNPMDPRLKKFDKIDW